MIIKVCFVFINFCRQSRQGGGMQYSLPRNSVVDHNHGPLKRQKKSHPIYSLPADPHSPIMPLQAIVGNKTYRVGLEYSWSCFLFTINNVLVVLNRWPPVKCLRHASCTKIMFNWHTHTCSHRHTSWTKMKTDFFWKIGKSGKIIWKYVLLLHPFSLAMFCWQGARILCLLFWCSITFLWMLDQGLS